MLRLYFGDESLFGLFRKRLGGLQCASYILVKVNLSSALLNIVRGSCLTSTISVLIFFTYPLEFLHCLLHLSHFGQTEVVVNQKQCYRFL